MPKNRKIGFSTKSKQGSSKYSACQRALNRALAKSLQVPVFELSTVAEAVAAKYLSKVSKAEQPKKIKTEENTADTYILPDKITHTADQDNITDTKIEEMKYETINYKCEKCGYKTNFFCSFQLHIENCAFRDKIPETDINLMIPISLPENVKKQLYDETSYHTEEPECDSCQQKDCSGHSYGMMNSSEDSNSENSCVQVIESILLEGDSSSNIQESQSENNYTDQIVIKQESSSNSYDQFEIIEIDSDMSESNEVQTSSIEQENDIIKEEHDITVLGNILNNQIEPTEQANVNDSLSIRLIGKHFPSYLPNTNENEVKLGFCAVCFNKKDHDNERIKKKTRYCCTLCRVNLCVVPCFRIYHTEINY